MFTQYIGCFSTNEFVNHFYVLRVCTLSCSTTFCKLLLFYAVSLGLLDTTCVTIFFSVLNSMFSSIFQVKDDTILSIAG